jgi:hypothetical protein
MVRRMRTYTGGSLTLMLVLLIALAAIGRFARLR